MPFATNAAFIGNQPTGSYYNAFVYYPGELYGNGSVVGGAQPGANLTMTTTGISATAVTGNVYTATIQVANVSRSNTAANPGPNVTLNILAGGVVVGTATLPGLAQGLAWTPVTATWTADAGHAGQAIHCRSWRTTSSKDQAATSSSRCPPWRLPMPRFRPPPGAPADCSQRSDGRAPSRRARST